MTGIDPEDQRPQPEPERAPPLTNSEWSSASAHPDDQWLSDTELSAPAAATEPGGEEPPVAAGIPAEGGWTAPARSRRVPWRPLGALLCFGAAVLTLAGSFLALFTSELRFGQVATERLTITITAWDLQAEAVGQPNPDVGSVPANGLPLAFAAAVLLAAAVLAILTAAAPSRGGIGRASAVTAMAAGAFLTGTVWAVGMQELGWQDTYGPTRLPEELIVETSVGIGFWLLVVAVAAAVAAIVFSLVPLRAKVPRVEPETPVLGIPSIGDAVVTRLPDEPPKEPS